MIVHGGEALVPAQIDLTQPSQSGLSESSSVSAMDPRFGASTTGTVLGAGNGNKHSGVFPGGDSLGGSLRTQMYVDASAKAEGSVTCLDDMFALDVDSKVHD
jgi:hypothetical protein